MTMQQKIEVATRCVKALQREGHEVLDVHMNLFEMRPVIEVAPLPRCRELGGHVTRESLTRRHALGREMMTAIVNDLSLIHI